MDGRVAANFSQARDTPHLVAVLHGPRDLRLEQRSIPAPASGQVLLEIRCVGICGSDVHYYEHGRIGSRVVREPLVLGHEACGTVAAVGSSVTHHQIGDRVCVEPGVPCGRCRECRTGHYNVCPELGFYGSPPIDGALGNYLAVHEDFVHALPDKISDEAGALIEPLAVALWACEAAALSPHKRVLVTGAGPVGLLVAQTARALGAADVVITDVRPERLDAAARLGFQQALDARDEPLAGNETGFDALIECSGRGAALESALGALRPGAVAVLVGMGEDHVTLPLDLLQRRELWVTGRFRYANVFPAAIALAANGGVELDGLITHRFPLEDAAEAVLRTQTDATVLKAVVIPGRGPVMTAASAALA
jgi:L-iditol 2-dehydrogenase